MNMSDQQKTIIMNAIHAGRDGTPDQQALSMAVTHGESDTEVLTKLIEQVSPAIGS